MIYTVGYAQLLPAQLLELAVALDVTVVDVRGRPMSRRPGFGRRQLETLLGARYEWRGDRLGGVHHLPNARTLWPGGLAQLVAEVERPLLLCQCHAPGACHRHQLARELAKREPPLAVTHLFEQEAIDAVSLEYALGGDDRAYDAVLWETAADLLMLEDDTDGVE